MKINPTPEFVMKINGKQYTKRQENFDEICAQYLFAPVDYNGNGSIKIG